MQLVLLLSVVSFFFLNRYGKDMVFCRMILYRSIKNITNENITKESSICYLIALFIAC
jgi:hypothetical protein